MYAEHVYSVSFSQQNKTLKNDFRFRHHRIASKIFYFLFRKQLIVNLPTNRVDPNDYRIKHLNWFQSDTNKFYETWFSSSW